MNIGKLLILLSFAGLLVSTVGYFLAARGKQRFESLGRAGYNYFAAFALLAGALLMYYFMSGDYSFRYVYDYSSSDLSLFYLISSFWAGQRGTYLLWIILVALFGFYIIRRGGEYRAWAMFFYGLIGIFFSVMLIVLSPFEKLPFVQPDGAGLNPLLKDPWMVIHPPVIFVGYAVVAVPCVIAMAALVKNKFDSWLKLALGPAVLGAVALAAGNIMGGFWAYKTLGWGGYWAWDPVENSSFIPWMTSLALIHGLIIERKNGAMRKTNLFMAIFTFLLVVYGTFLTRSGVLADFSVHSFVDLGANVYLIGFMVGFSALALLIFLWRARSITGPPVNLSITSKEFVLVVSVWILLLVGLMVLAGTSWPLITTLFGQPGAVDTAVYTRVTFPLAMAIGLFLGVAPFLVRNGATSRKLFMKLIPAAIAAVAATVTAAAVGVSTISYLIYIFFASLALFSNLIALAPYFPKRLLSAGAQISHFGFALMLIGILGSSAYSETQKVVIDRNASHPVFGLDITYKGMAGDITTPDNEIILNVNDGKGDDYEIRPKLYWAQRMEGLMKRPHIIRYPLYDLYLAPEQIQELGGQKGVRIVRGESEKIGPYTITFRDFDQQAHETGGLVRFGAILDVIDSAGNRQTVVPIMEFNPDRSIGHTDVPIMPGSGDTPVRLEKILADEAAVMISVAGLTPDSPPDRLALEASKKPTMNFLWAGAIIIVLGGVITLRKRWSRTNGSEGNRVSS